MKRVRAILALLTVCTAGCNCEGRTVCTFLTPSTATTGSAAGPTAGSAAGIWVGTDSASGLQLTGFVNANGQADFIRSDGIQFVGTTQVSGTSLQIALNGYTQYGYQFSDGSTFGTGTLAGTFSSGSAINATLQFTTSENTPITSTWSLTFDSLYDTASSLGTASGTYTDDLAAVSNGVDPLSGASVTISSTGVMNGRGSAFDCVLNGTLSDTDTSVDLFEISYTYESCSGSAAVLNGVAFNGLAELNTTASPAVMIIAVTGQSITGASYGIVSDLSGG